MRTSTTPIRTFAAIALTGMVVAACGQKPTVAHIDNGVGGGGTSDVAGFQTDPNGGVGTDTTGGLTTDGTGTTDTTTDTSGGAVVGDATGGATTDTSGGTTTTDTSGGTTTDGSGGGGTTTTTTTPGTENSGGGDGGGGGDAGGGGEAPAAPSNKPTGSDRTGVTEDSITVAVHAPATGAAPLPTTSFENARDTYWKWVTQEKGQKVLGRSTVKVEYADDKYAPDTAINVCRNLASKSFLLVGGGGTDQIQACGSLAAQARFPYFSAGVTENGLAGNPWYFAASMSYRQQGGLLAQYVKKNPNKIDKLGPSAKIGTIITNTPNFKDALNGWRSGLQANGLAEMQSFEHPKGDTSWYADTAQRFQAEGVEVIYFLSSPVDYLNFANTANERFGYNPQYIGVGISKAIDAVLASGCGDANTRIDNGIFLHPYPALDKVNAVDPDFNAAAKKFGTPNDDIALALWGLAKTQHELFKKYEAVFGTDLTREDFRALVEGGSGTISTGIYPNLQYSGQNHFGANSAWVLQADCATKKHTTLTNSAVSGF